MSSQAASGSPKKPSVVRCIVLPIIGFTLALALVLLLCLLAGDVFTIPYLTPFAHFLATIFAPLVPFIFPVHLALFSKVVRYRAGTTSPVRPYGIRSEWKGKKMWVFITVSWVFQHLTRVVGDMENLLYAGSSELVGKRMGWTDMDVCPLEKCRGPWVEAAATLLVMLLEVGNVKWDGGYMDMWVEGLVKQGQKAENKAVEDMEEGIKSEKEGLMSGNEKTVVVEEKVVLVEEKV